MGLDTQNRVLPGLLLAALSLSAGLNCYLLGQRTEQAIDYELEAGLPSSIAELELEQARAQLAACQATRPAATATADSTRWPAR